MTGSLDEIVEELLKIHHAFMQAHLKTGEEHPAYFILQRLFDKYNIKTEQQYRYRK